jgi:small-conductance mechanosensitive channel
METITAILQQTYFNNQLSDYCEAVLFCFLCIIFIKIIRNNVIKRLHELSKKTKTTIDDFLISVVQKIAVPLVYFGAFVVSSEMLVLHENISKLIGFILKGVVVLFIARAIVMFIDYGVNVYMKKAGFKAQAQKSLSGIVRVTKILIWALAIVSFCDSLGFKVTGLLAGLGIGGIAVAMAAQAVLKDLFSYFSIIIDRPFEIGDFIIVDDKMGAVVHIGIKTTRISSLGGEQIIFSNTDLTDSRVRNYKRMAKRRVVFGVGVTYDTPVKKLEEIPAVIKDIISGVEDVTFDRAHFQGYGDFSLNYEMVYYVNGNDYTKYMDIQQEINLKIFRAFEERGIEFAFPTQTIHVNKQ